MDVSYRNAENNLLGLETQMTYDPIIHCALCRNKLNRITPCWGLREIGRYDCAGGECPIARWWDEIKSKEKAGE